MRSRAARLTLAMLILIGAVSVSPCIAQTQVTSLEELRRALAAGDFITVVAASGQPVAGQLTRLGTVDLDVRPDDRGGGPRNVTILLDTIQSLERPRDSVRNGTIIGAGIGAGLGGAMFISAAIIDRNEIDEWAKLYGGFALICTGIGAVIGRAVDGVQSKPHIRFDAPARRHTRISVQPVYSRGRGIGLAVSLSR